MAPRINTTIAIAVGITAGIAAGTGLFTFHYAHGTSYLRDDPEVCANCHIMQGHLDSWSKGSHHAVAVCNDCHMPKGFVPKCLAKARNGFHHSVAFTTGNFHEPILITPGNRDITEQACRTCHRDIVMMIDHPVENRIHGVSCIRCHSGVGHR